MASFDADAPPPPTARLIPLPRNCARAGTPSDCCLALVLDGVLSADECAGLVARGKDAGPRYVTEARHVVDGVVTYIPIQKPKKYKVSVFEDAALGDDLWARLRARCGASIAAFAERDGWAPARGLNKRMRVLHYSGADQFEPHYDRVVPEEDSDRHSLITVLVYLNDGGADADEGGPEEAGAASFGGGETLFLDYTGRAPAHKVVPKAGRVVLFEHDLYHSGAPLLDAAGHKYVMRTDVMFNVEKAGAGTAPEAPPAEKPEDLTVESLLVKHHLEHVRPALEDLGLLGSIEGFRTPGRGAIMSMLLEVDVPFDDIRELIDVAFEIERGWCGVGTARS